MSSKQKKHTEIVKDSEKLTEQLTTTDIRELSDDEILKVSGGAEIQK